MFKSKLVRKRMVWFVFREQSGVSFCNADYPPILFSTNRSDSNMWGGLNWRNLLWATCLTYAKRGDTKPRGWTHVHVSQFFKRKQLIPKIADDEMKVDKNSIGVKVDSINCTFVEGLLQGLFNF